MKKQLLVYLAAMTFLIGCSNNPAENVADNKSNNQPAVEEQVSNETEENKEETAKIENTESPENEPDTTEKAEEKESLNNGELIDMITSSDMDSYKLYIEGKTEQVTANADPIETDSYDSQVEFTKYPRAYHTFHHINMPEAEIDIEYYSDGETLFYRQDEGGWMEIPYEEGTDQLEADAKEQSDANLKALAEYYTVTETDSSYIVELVSTPENIDAIQAILSDKATILDTNEYVDLAGQLTHIRYRNEYSKDGYYPMTFESETEFTNDNGDITRISQNGEFTEVNQIDKIEIPEEVLAMF